jgi:CDP-diacylglycerol--glycerol-3-phosphate 3-phosphatidyltransferase
MAPLLRYQTQLLLTVSIVWFAPSSGSSFVPSSRLQLLTVHDPTSTNRRVDSTPETLMLSTILRIQGGSSFAEDNNVESQPSTNDVDGFDVESPIPVHETMTSSILSSVATTSPPPSSDAQAVSSAPPPPSLLGPNAPPPGWLRRQLPTFPWHRLPNMLTYARCIAIPALIVLFYIPTTKLPNGNIYSGMLFAGASMTDWLDGYLARLWDITSPFGAFLDPVADKLMVSTSLILLAGQFGPVIAIPSLIILAREIAVSALREWMAQRGQRDVVKVGMQGKVKTALTMFALTVLLFVPSNLVMTVPSFYRRLYEAGTAMLYVSALVTITSGSVYFIAAAPLLFDKK